MSCKFAIVDLEDIFKGKVTPEQALTTTFYTSAIRFYEFILSKNCA